MAFSLILQVFLLKDPYTGNRNINEKGILNKPLEMNENIKNEKKPKLGFVRKDKNSFPSVQFHIEMFEDLSYSFYMTFSLSLIVHLCKS